VRHNFTSLIASESAYCSLQQFYQGPHERCRRTIRQVYGADLRLLYPGALAMGAQALLDADPG
jgi:hypothetical protein